MIIVNTYAVTIRDITTVMITVIRCGQEPVPKVGRSIPPKLYMV